MSATEDLVAILSGRRPNGGLLQNCRMEAAGGDFYGEEAVLERCRTAPLDLADAETVRGGSQVALFRKKAAVVADLHGERIGRIWAIGQGGPAEAEPRVAVPFDPDLRQERGGVIADPADHPHADAALVAGLAAAGARLVEEAALDGERPAYRVHAFLIRAWGGNGRGAGLFAVHRLGPGPVRPAGFGYAAVLIDGGEERIVRDRAGEAAPSHARL